MGSDYCLASSAQRGGSPLLLAWFTLSALLLLALAMDFALHHPSGAAQAAPGYCRATDAHTPVDACVMDDQGVVPSSRMPLLARSWADVESRCVKFCRACSRCQYVSFSLRWNSCSWYHSCNLNSLVQSRDSSFRSRRVRSCGHGGCRRRRTQHLPSSSRTGGTMVFDVGMNAGQSTRAFLKRALFLIESASTAPHGARMVTLNSASHIIPAGGFRVVAVEADPALSLRSIKREGVIVLSRAVARQSNVNVSLCVDGPTETHHLLVGSAMRQCRKALVVRSITCKDLIRTHGTASQALAAKVKM